MSTDSGYQRRGYQGAADLRAMQMISQRLCGPESRWHPGELAWLRSQDGEGEADGGRRAAGAGRVALWEHRGQPVAWARAVPKEASSGSVLDLHLDPAHLELAPDVLAWFDKAGTGSERAVTVLDAEADLIALLGRHGYRESTGAAHGVHLRRGLRDLPIPQPPEGYFLRQITGRREAGRRAALHRALGSATGSGHDVTADGYRRVMDSWPYRPELDWLAGTTAEGTLVSGGLAWFDEPHRAAVIEPVETLPEHRGRGLARSVLLALLHQARLLGAEASRVRVRGDLDLSGTETPYQDLGFRVSAREVTLSRSG